VQNTTKHRILDALTPVLVGFGFIVKVLYGAAFSWWLDPWLQRKANRALLDDVQSNLYSLKMSASPIIYFGIGELAESAEKIKGFPRNPSDKRTLEFGAFAPKAAGGAATLSFYCRDSAGHASVEVKIESDHCERSPAQSVLASPVDEFLIGNRECSVRSGLCKPVCNMPHRLHRLSGGVLESGILIFSVRPEVLNCPTHRRKRVLYSAEAVMVDLL